MRLKSCIVSVAALAASVAAQVVTYTNGNHAISVNIPSDTASSGSGPIFFQISAPSGTSWIAFGQGTRMAGSNMFVVYSNGQGNVTLSPRLGTGHSMPRHDDSAQVTLLEGSGVNNGAIVANIRCDNCNSWSGGSMSLTSTSSSWIYASRSGNALDTDDVAATISQHNQDASFSLDLTAGTGGSSSNPFAAVAAEPSASESGNESASATATATRTGSSTASSIASSTNGVSNPVASTGADSGSSASSSQTVSDNTSTLLSTHGIIMSLLFVGIFPLASLTLYLPFAAKVRFVHAPLQVVAMILLIVGMALGIVLGNRISELDGYHQIIGFVVVAALVLFQPAMGIYQHLHYRKTGGRSAFGIAHRWLGRSMIILGIINGGIGWMVAGNTSAYVPYAVVAVIVFLIYLAVLLFAWWKSGKEGDKALNEKIGAVRTGGSGKSSNRSYEMQPPRQPRHQRLVSDDVTNPSMYRQQQQQQQQRAPRRTDYTVSSSR